MEDWRISNEHHQRKAIFSLALKLPLDYFRIRTSKMGTRPSSHHMYQRWAMPLYSWLVLRSPDWKQRRGRKSWHPCVLLKNNNRRQQRKNLIPWLTGHCKVRLGLLWHQGTHWIHDCQSHYILRDMIDRLFKIKLMQLLIDYSH